MNENLELNARVTPIKYLSNGIGLRLLTVVEDFGIRTQLVLIIEETTNKTQVYNSFTNIEAHRDDLITQMGSDFSNKSDYVLLELSRMNDRDFGYGKIAKILNYRCIALICCAYYTGANYEQVGTWGIGILGLHYLFDGLRLNEELLIELLEVGYEDLRHDRLPWKLKDGPFDRDRVKEPLRYFNKKIHEGKLVVNPELDESFISEEDTYLLLNGWYEKANDLIKKNDLRYWNYHKKWISKWLDTLSREIESSSKKSVVIIRESIKSGGKS